MNKEESTVDEFDEDSVEDNTESDESSVPLSQFEKIKDDYLRLAADFDNYKKRSEIKKNFLFDFVIFFIFRIHQSIKSYSCSYNSLISFNYFTIFFYNSR